MATRIADLDPVFQADSPDLPLAGSGVNPSWQETWLEGKDPEQVRCFRTVGRNVFHFGVALCPTWPPDPDVLVGIGALLWHGKPVLLLEPGMGTPLPGLPTSLPSFLHHPHLFRFTNLDDLVAFADLRIVRRRDSHTYDFWLPAGEAVLTAKDVVPGDRVWYPCDTLWEPGVVAGVDERGPYPTEVTDALREAYRDCRKPGPEGPDGAYAPLDDADILASTRRAWENPFIFVNELGGDPHRNGAIGRFLRRRTA